MKNKLNERIKNFNITILISLFLLISCGSGQLQAGKDGEAATGGRSLSEVLMEVGRSAENAFYSFLELLSDTLGFTAKSTTKKDEVGKYFSELGVKLGKASEELEAVAKNSEVEGVKDGSISVAIRGAVDTAKEVLGMLKGHLDSLKDIGDGTVVGEAASNKEGEKPADVELKKAYNTLKGIVDIAYKEGISKPEAGEVAVQANGGADNKDGAKILSTDSTGKPVAGDSGKAAAILTTVSGKEMLASIVASGENDPELSQAAKAETTAMSFARGNNGNHLANAAAKAAAVAGGIALRSLVKSGKLASGAGDGNAGGKEEVQAVGIDAVNKLLVAVEDIIKKTVKNVLEKARGEIDKARAPKPEGQ
ncbi:variable large family protein [Borrelia turicatae]|uniref:Variable large protein n=1 Tax=Borrelia turicatae (strain 91E135) TaxID=314724 RepID=A0ABF7R023_BORT9|nr:variable large family protein [Borrelia turicatae]ASJ27706.1 VlpA10 [Borrelia turicatae 91E135]UPA14145.1 variable large family protein [Borrelia turicatae 91E135]